LSGLLKNQRNLLNIENERCQVSYTSENKTDQPKSNLCREPSANYIEMATRTDKRRLIKDPDGYGKRTGTCGDTVEMFLIVRHNRIHKVFFVTDGCINTHACANSVAFLAEGKRIEKAWEITPEKVIRFLETLPEENTHCAELAVGALYLALVNFQEFRHAPWKRFYGKRT
jgi:nitrogen fixation NifU-like protein